MYDISPPDVSLHIPPNIYPKCQLSVTVRGLLVVLGAMYKVSELFAYLLTYNALQLLKNHQMQFLEKRTEFGNLGNPLSPQRADCYYYTTVISIDSVVHVASTTIHVRWIH